MSEENPYERSSLSVKSPSPNDFAISPESKKKHRPTFPAKASPAFESKLEKNARQKTTYSEGAKDQSGLPPLMKKKTFVEAEKMLE